MTLMEILCLILFVTGVFFLSRVFTGHKEPRAIKSPRPICGCTHHLSYHDRKTGECNNFQPGVEYKNEDGGPKGLVTCRCKQYIGPEPYTQYYVPEIAEEVKGND